jgi:hypothetical protein
MDDLLVVCCILSLDWIDIDLLGCLIALELGNKEEYLYVLFVLYDLGFKEVVKIVDVVLFDLPNI